MNITKEILEDYPNICAEIDDLSTYLRTVVGDTVQDGRSGHPHSRLILGVPEGNKERERLTRLKSQKLAIEKFVDNLPTSRQRRIIFLKAIKGEKWDTVAANMGHKYSADSVKQTYSRICKKYFK